MCPLNPWECPQPSLELFDFQARFIPVMSWTGVTSMGSNVTPITTSLPFGPRPSISADIAFELGAVARMTCAPPSFCNSSAGFVALLSMYTLAPSFFASAAFSDPRPIAATLYPNLLAN